MRFALSWRGVVGGGLALAAVFAAGVLAGPTVLEQLGPNRPAGAEPAVSPLAALERSSQAVVTGNVALSLGPEDHPPTASQAATHGIDAPLAAAPSLPPVSAFEPLAPVTIAASPELSEPDLEGATLNRLQEIRGRLEQLGAEYVIVETTEGSGRYRFHCRMLVDAESRFTRPFESIGPDPLAAAEAVLSEVESWRTAAAGPATRLE